MTTKSLQDLLKEKKISTENSSADQKNTVEISKEERIKKARDNMLKSLKIPRKYQPKGFSDFDVSNLNNPNAEALVADIKRYAESAMKISKNNWAFLTGDVGLGKTHLAIAAFKEAACQWAEYIALKNINPYNVGRTDIGRNFRYVTCSSLLQELKDSYDTDLFTEHGTLLKYKDAPLLLLDDLGTERASEWQQEKLYIILNHRYNNYLPTIITTNLDSKELEVHINKRMMDRIVEATNGGENIWRLIGSSYRMRGMSEWMKKDLKKRTEGIKNFKRDNFNR